jgi:hypothetical protein
LCRNQLTETEFLLDEPEAGTPQDSQEGGHMKRVHLGISRGIAVAATGTLAVTAFLAMGTPSTFATNNTPLRTSTLTIASPRS